MEEVPQPAPIAAPGGPSVVALAPFSGPPSTKKAPPVKRPPAPTARPSATAAKESAPSRRRPTGAVATSESPVRPKREPMSPQEPAEHAANGGAPIAAKRPPAPNLTPVSANKQTSLPSSRAAGVEQRNSLPISPGQGSDGRDPTGNSAVQNRAQPPVLQGASSVPESKPPAPQSAPKAPTRLVPVKSMIAVVDDDDDDDDDFVSGDESPIKLQPQASRAPAPTTAPKTQSALASSSSSRPPRERNALPVSTPLAMTPTTPLAPPLECAPSSVAMPRMEPLSPGDGDPQPVASSDTQRGSIPFLPRREPSEPRGGEMDFSVDPIEDILEKEERLGIKHVKPAPRIATKTLSRLAQPKVKRSKHFGGGSSAGDAAPAKPEPSETEAAAFGTPASDLRVVGPPATARQAATSATAPAHKAGADSFYLLIRCLGSEHRAAVDRKTLLMSVAHALELPLGGHFVYRGMPVHTHATPVTLGLRQGPERVSMLAYEAPVEQEEELARHDVVVDQVRAWTRSLAALMAALMESRRVPHHHFADASGKFDDAAPDVLPLGVQNDYDAIEATHVAPGLSVEDGDRACYDEDGDSDDGVLSIASESRSSCSGGSNADEVLELMEDDDDGGIAVSPPLPPSLTRTPIRKQRNSARAIGMGMPSSSPWRLDGRPVESPELIRASSSARVRVPGARVGEELLEPQCKVDQDWRRTANRAPSSGTATPRGTSPSMRKKVEKVYAGSGGGYASMYTAAVAAPGPTTRTVMP